MTLWVNASATEMLDGGIIERENPQTILLAMSMISDNHGRPSGSRLSLIDHNEIDGSVIDLHPLQCFPHIWRFIHLIVSLPGSF